MKTIGEEPKERRRRRAIQPPFCPLCGLPARNWDEEWLIRHKGECFRPSPEHSAPAASIQEPIP